MVCRASLIQQTFASLVLAHGLTSIDASGVNSSTTLIPSLTTVAFLSQTEENTFIYSAKAGETFTAYITKDAVTQGNWAWIADQFAKSPVYA